MGQRMIRNRPMEARLVNVKTAVSSFLEFFSGIPTLPTRRALAAVELAVMLHLNGAPSRKPHLLIIHQGHPERAE